jgi:hypothetical protein
VPTKHEQTTDAKASETLFHDAPMGESWQRQSETPVPSINNAHHMARGLTQAFSLNPILGLSVITTDAMVTAVDVVSLGITAPELWLIASLFTFFIVFRGQQKWGGDDRESALLKAAIVAFLVALPTPFPSFLTVPSAIVGTVQMLRRKD